MICCLFCSTELTDATDHGVVAAAISKHLAVCSDLSARDAARRARVAPDAGQLEGAAS